MDNFYIKDSLADSQPEFLKQKRILQMSEFVANALEYLPISKRALVIQAIRKMQDWYRSGTERYLSKQTKLSIQLMRIEHYRMNPEFYLDPDNSRYHVPRSYGEAVRNYLTSIPVQSRDHVLSALCSIISNVTNAKEGAIFV